MEESRKIEKVTQIETKLTAAEQKREKELQKKLENIKKHVGSMIFYGLICFTAVYYILRKIYVLLFRKSSHKISCYIDCYLTFIIT